MLPDDIQRDADAQSWKDAIIEYSQKVKEGKIRHYSFSDLPYLSYLVKYGEYFSLNGEVHHTVKVNIRQNIRKWPDDIILYCNDNEIDWISDQNVYDCVIEAIFDEKTRERMDLYRIKEELGI